MLKGREVLTIKSIVADGRYLRRDLNVRPVLSHKDMLEDPKSRSIGIGGFRRSGCEGTRSSSGELDPMAARAKAAAAPNGTDTVNATPARVAIALNVRWSRKKI